MNIDDLQVVLIEDLSFLWKNDEIRNLYCDLMKIKLDGYSSVYGENVISSDKADFFGMHLMVCEKGEKLKPLFGYKSVTLEKCNEYHLNFPALSLVSKDGHKECLIALEGIINRSGKQGNKVSFDYSWAQDPCLKNARTPEEAQMFRDLIMMLVVQHHKTYEIPDMLTCGVVKVKTDLFFEKMGLDKISSKSLFSQSDLNDELVHIFHSNGFSEYAYSAAGRYEELWARRIVFSKEAIEKSVKKSA